MMTCLTHAVRNVNQVPGTPRVWMSLLVCAILNGELTMIQMDLPLEDSDFGDTSDKTSDIHIIQSERHVDVVLESKLEIWKAGGKVILVRVSTCASTP